MISGRRDYCQDTNWLANVSSGAWVVVGAFISLLGTFLVEAWRAHRESRTRAERVADRTRGERREVYAEVLVSAHRAEGEFYRHFNNIAMRGEYGSPGIEMFDSIWDQVTGDFSERSARARLVASAPVRSQLNAVGEYFNKGVFALAESETKWLRIDGSPVLVLEELLAFELAYRNGPEARSQRDVDRAVEAKRRDLVGRLSTDPGDEVASDIRD